ncbi:hypothetical protein C9J46_21350, partial [Photobacterium sp. GB-36]
LKLLVHTKDNARLLFVITLHDISNIYLYKVAWACPTLRIGVGFATHILICYKYYLDLDEEILL